MLTFGSPSASRSASTSRTTLPVSACWTTGPLRAVQSS